MTAMPTSAKDKNYNFKKQFIKEKVCQTIIH